MGQMVKRGKGPKGVPSSQGDKKPTVLTKPNLTRPRDGAHAVNNGGPQYGKKNCYKGG